MPTDFKTEIRGSSLRKFVLQHLPVTCKNQLAADIQGIKKFYYYFNAIFMPFWTHMKHHTPDKPTC